MKAVVSNHSVFSARWMARSVLDCDGKRSATPLSYARGFSDHSKSLFAPKRRRPSAVPAHSKVWRRLVILAFILLPSSFCLRAVGQSYAIDWFKIAGGGGTSTGGVYSVSGTIGQLDAGGPLTNGQYSLTGGFWVLPIAVQATNAPTLTIVPATPGNATISWTPNTPGFVLQETWVLSSANWTNSPSGATNPIVVPAALPTKFYRVFKP